MPRLVSLNPQLLKQDGKNYGIIRSRIDNVDDDQMVGGHEIEKDNTVWILQAMSLQ